MEPLGDPGLAQPCALPPVEDALHAVAQHPGGGKASPGTAVHRRIGRQLLPEILAGPGRPGLAVVDVELAFAELLLCPWVARGEAVNRIWGHSSG